MNAQPQRKDRPVSMRLPEGDLALIDRAAGLRGRSRTEFVREAAMRAAEDVLLEQRIVRMTPAGFDDFLQILAEPSGPVPAMVELATRPAPWEPGYVKRR